MDKLQLTIVTPNEMIFDGEADRVMVRTLEGDVPFCRATSITPLRSQRVKAGSRSMIKCAARASMAV